ncbi:MAG TPA: hydrogenase maturation nickel metallochaperone HypA [Candidatus Cottocaccamicrobium excrementipullorum]|nr:hydrogenase maturation nickel metallochaperone HypA [Candidatus Cottocaccamicrobium excrementipullorum]
MHELAITEQILKVSLEAAKEQSASRIQIIRLAMGPFSGVVPECIQMYLDVLAKGTIAEGALVEARTLPLKVLCRDCGKESEITRRHICCPFCGSIRLKTLSGKEFMIESLEVDINGNQSPSSSNGVESGCKPSSTAEPEGKTDLPD